MGLPLLKRVAAWLSDLRLAIVLLLLIALASATGTVVASAKTTCGRSLRSKR